jgi:hypothetical protein
MTYAQDIAISGILSGTGTGTGNGFFDEGGAIDTLNLTSIVDSLGAVITTSLTYEGTISGTTFTGNGTSTSVFISCTGVALVCGLAGSGTTTTTGGDILVLDTLTGGNWQTSSTLATGGLTLDVDHSLVPLPPPPVVPIDPNAIPTMPIYGLGITAIALFGIAARRLRTTRKPQ